MVRRAWLVSLALAAAPARALAGSCDAPQTSGCVDADTFWPYAGPRRFAAVGGTETVAGGAVGFGLVGSWQTRPVVLSVPDPGGNVDKPAIDHQVTTTFSFAWGIARRLELDAMLPVTIVQSGVGLQPISGGEALHDTVARDLRFGATWAPWPWLAARFHASAPTGEKHGQLAGDRGAVLAPSVAASYELGRFLFGAEVGARLRGETALVGNTIGSQLAFGAGVGATVLPRDLLFVGLEARVLPTLASQGTVGQTPTGLIARSGGGVLAPAEWMLSARTAPLASGDLAIQLAGGTALDRSVTAPSFRMILALVFAPRERKEAP